MERFDFAVSASGVLLSLLVVAQNLNDDLSSLLLWRASVFCVHLAKSTILANKTSSDGLYMLKGVFG